MVGTWMLSPLFAKQHRPFVHDHCPWLRGGTFVWSSPLTFVQRYNRVTWPQQRGHTRETCFLYCDKLWEPFPHLKHVSLLLIILLIIVPDNKKEMRIGNSRSFPILYPVSLSVSSIFGKNTFLYLTILFEKQTNFSSLLSNKEYFIYRTCSIFGKNRPQFSINFPSTIFIVDVRTDQFLSVEEFFSPFVKKKKKKVKVILKE